MLEISYNNKVRKEAIEHAKRMAETSFKAGTRFYSYKYQGWNNEESSYLGKIAEVVFLEWLVHNGVVIVRSPLDDLAYNDPKTNFDGDFEVNNKNIEIKTKTCNCKPKQDYDVGSTRISKADFYVFSRIWDDVGKIFFVGFISNQDFRNKSKFREKGTSVDNPNNQGFKCLSNEYVCRIYDLNDMGKFLEVLNG